MTGGLPRLLKGIPVCAGMSLDEHLAVHGDLPFLDRPRRAEERVLISEVDRAGLTGHGGAGFPTAAKLRAVAAARGRPVVLVNATEGEPTSLKDKLLLERLPHLVLDGAVLAARALGTDEVIVAIEDDAAAAASVSVAIAERPRSGKRGPGVRIAHIPVGFVNGQETAVVNAVNGGPPKPTMTPPYPAQRGVGRRATFVSNAETLAQLALIARHGAAWYRSIGTKQGPGSRLVTIGGAVARPGVLEIENGTSLHALVEAAGGATQAISAFLLGGYGGTWIDSDTTAITLDESWLRKRNLTLGAGIVIALPASACPVAEVARVARWSEQESAGQCGPCVHGLHTIASSLEELCDHGDRTGAYAHLKRWCTLVTGRGACAHPDGTARFVRSALRTFATQFEDHARHGRCAGCVQPAVLPLPAGYLQAAA